MMDYAAVARIFHVAFALVAVGVSAALATTLGFLVRNVDDDRRRKKTTS